MAKGWIKLHRSIMNNEMWLSEPFTKSQAWIDLLLLASGCGDGHYKRGSVYRGKDFLSKRWKWSRGKVIRFIDGLEKKGMVTQYSTQGGTHNGTVLTLVKWDFFQGMQTQNGTHCRTQNGTPKRIKEDIPPINGGIITDDDEDESTYIDPLELLKRDKEAGLL